MKLEDLAVKIVKHYDKLYDDQSNWRSLWQDLADYISPKKSSCINQQRSPGTSQTDNLYDSTAIHSNELLAATMNGALTSSSVKWFALRIRGVQEDKYVEDWLEDCSAKMYRAFQQSNFNSEIHEAYLDLGAFGMAGIEVMEKEIEVPGFNGLQFKTYNIGEYVIDEDADGRVDTIIRKIRMSARAAYEKWGDTVGEDIKNKATGDKLTDEVELLFAILPAKTLGVNQKVHKIVSVLIDYKTKHLIKMSGFREFPVCVPRWAKSSGEKEGRGPGFTALPDIKTLNKAVELGLKAWAKAIDPPLEVEDDGVIGSVRLQPSGITYVRKTGTVKPLDFGARFDVTHIKEEDLKTSIRRIFFSDQLQFQDTPQMTATEVYVRYELMQRLLGPTLGRLEAELFNRLIERTFNLMLRAGAFLPVPPALKGREIDIEYEGPMARAQKSSEIVAIQRTFEIIGPISQANPEVLDWYDMNEIAKFAPTVTGMPSRLLRNEKQVLKIRTDRAKEAAERQKKQDLRDLAEGAKNVAPLISTMQENKNEGEVRQ